jgi:SET domain-containing protein
VFCSDSAKFMNHSSNPNCHDPQDYLTIAARDRAAGEELTCDYSAFDANVKEQPEFRAAS